jgi:diguanylate cyclase (GGDEF)-like protein/PAS domain S-box-containing protein
MPTVVAAVVAVATAGGIVSLSWRADQRRHEQLLLARVDAQTYQTSKADWQMLSAIRPDAMDVAQREHREAQRVVLATVRELHARARGDSVLRDSLAEIERRVGRLHDALEVVYNLAAAGRVAEAIEFDTTRADPAAAQLHASLAHAGVALDEAARRGNLEANVGMVLLVLLASAVVATLLRRFADARRREDVAAAQRRAATEHEARFRALVQHASDLILVVDDTDVVRYASPSATAVLGQPADALTGTPIATLLGADGDGDVRALLRGADADGTRSAAAPSTWRMRHANGHWVAVEVVRTDLRDVASVGGIVLNARDVTERVALQQQLAHLALHDPLTDLPNRSLFRERIDRAMVRARSGRNGSAGAMRPPAVLFLDLDDFKAVNDSLGHSAGDQLLAEIAARLLSATRGSDTVARLGGDEFAVLLEEIADRREAVHVAERILQSLALPVAIDGTEVHVGASIGMAIAERDDDSDELLRNADLAMYLAKRGGKGGYVWYAPEQHLAVRERLQLEADLRHALDRDEFHVVYQPIMDLREELVVGMEALVRWQHPTRGLVMPNDFIEAAESTGVIQRLGRWVLREACRQGALWHDSAWSDAAMTMSVNVSVVQLRAGEQLLTDVRDALRDSGLPPTCLQLEITESAAIQDARDATDVLTTLRALGVRLAIDDFGTGYSSLSYLERLPIDVLKIDKAFVDRLTAEEGDGSPLVPTILAIAQALGLRVIAEGIELPAQSDELQALGCALGQGFLFARPLAPDDVPAFVETHTLTRRAG